MEVQLPQRPCCHGDAHILPSKVCLFVCEWGFAVCLPVCVWFCSFDKCSYFPPPRVLCYKWDKGQANAHCLFFTGKKSVQMDSIRSCARSELDSWFCGIYCTLVKGLICPSFDGWQRQTFRLRFKEKAGMSAKLHQHNNRCHFLKKSFKDKNAKKRITIWKHVLENCQYASDSWIQLYNGESLVIFIAVSLSLAVLRYSYCFCSKWHTCCSVDIEYLDNPAHTCKL